MDLLDVCRLITGAVLSAAAAGMWLNMPWFVQVVGEYRLLPKASVPFVAVLIAASELVCGVSMLFRFVHPWSSIAGFMLMALFTAAVLVNLRRGQRQLECGCAGRPGTPISWKGVIQNVGLLGFAGLAAADSVIEPAPGYTRALFAVCLALFVIPLVQNWYAPRDARLVNVQS